MVRIFSNAISVVSRGLGQEGGIFLARVELKAGSRTESRDES